MIISHSKKFIFIKPRKVAGTTIELRLSPYLESGDYATSIEPHEESLRYCKPGVFVGKIRKKTKLGFSRRLRDHSTLKKAYSILGQEIQNYFIITACRNPWDRAVSQFFWSYRKKNILQTEFKTQKKEFNKFTRRYGPKNWLDSCYGRKRQRRLNSSHLYSINNRIMANFVIRYEYLESDFAKLTNILQLPERITEQKVSTKSTFRSLESRHWQMFYEEDTKELVRECCSAEINSFNYDFEGTLEPTGMNLESC